MIHPGSKLGYGLRSDSEAHAFSLFCALGQLVQPRIVFFYIFMALYYDGNLKWPQ